MGQGLGKNSPVILTLTRENYEALIDRHGQWMRWRVGLKCPCSTKGQPDIHCTKCGGLGWVYTWQEAKTINETVMCSDTSGIVEVSSDYEECELVKVYDTDGNTYTDAVKQGCYVILGATPEKGAYVTVVMRQTELKTLETAECEKLGAGYYRVEGLRKSRSDIDGLYHDVPCDIEAIEAITDAAGNVYEAVEFRQDCFYIEPLTETTTTTDDEGNETETTSEIEITEPVTAAGVSYLEPALFVLLSQNLNETDAQALEAVGGDAVLTFPYNCDVAEGDVLTVLSGSFTQKAVIKRKVDTAFDVIEAYFVDEITRCFSSDREYTTGEDFLLLGANRIKWLAEDAPEEGENYSVVYKVCPTYRVLQNIPQIRTSENQRMPKKAVVKLLASYAENRKLNRQV